MSIETPVMSPLDPSVRARDYAPRLAKSIRRYQLRSDSPFIRRIASFKRTPSLVCQEKVDRDDAYANAP